MKRVLFIISLFSLSLPVAARTPVNADLDGVVASFAAASTQIGVSVRSLGSDRDVYGYEDRLPLNPASTMKIVTAAAALKYLGGTYSFRTLLSTDQNVNGVIRNLYVKGVGDPALTSERLKGMAKRLAALGIRKVAGDIVIDESYFVPDPPLTAGLRGHMARNAALIVNLAFADVSDQSEGGDVPDDLVTRAYGSSGGLPQYAARGLAAARKPPVPAPKITKNAKRSKRPAPIADPAIAAGESLKADLQEAGVIVAGKAMAGDDRGFIVLGEDRSIPLSDIVREMNKRSSNFIAEMLLKSLSAEKMGPPGSLEKGSAFLSDFLGYNGVPSSEFRVTSGSGLSRDSRLSARALTQVLTLAHEDGSMRDDFVASLPIAGVDGTLRRRFSSPDLIGNVRAKTGTLADTRSLTGYLKTEAGHALAFAIVVNGPGISKAYQLQETLLQKLFDEY